CISVVSFSRVTEKDSVTATLVRFSMVAVINAVAPAVTESGASIATTATSAVVTGGSTGGSLSSSLLKRLQDTPVNISSMKIIGFFIVLSLCFIWGYDSLIFLGRWCLKPFVCC